MQEPLRMDLKHAPTPPNPLDYYTPSVVWSPPDSRDYAFPRAGFVRTAELPPRVVLPIARRRANQGQRGSCAAFAGVRMLAMQLAADPDAAPDLSEEYTYADARRAMNWLCSDAGSVPREVFKSLCTVGVPTEAEVPYLSRDLCWNPRTEFGERVWPVRGQEYARVASESLEELKQVLNTGVRVSACFTLFRNWTPGPDGLFPWPEGGAWGGHMMDFYGYDDTFLTPHGLGALFIENQWGQEHGKDGTIVLPYPIFNLPPQQGGCWKNDLWTVRAAARPEPEPAPPPVVDWKTPALAAVAAVQSGITTEYHQAIYWHERVDKELQLKGVERVAAAIKGAL